MKHAGGKKNEENIPSAPSHQALNAIKTMPH
jgi:hypothetical protein